MIPPSIKEHCGEFWGLHKSCHDRGCFTLLSFFHELVPDIVSWLALTNKQLQFSFWSCQDHRIECDTPKNKHSHTGAIFTEAHKTDEVLVYNEIN